MKIYEISTTDLYCFEPLEEGASQIFGRTGKAKSRSKAKITTQRFRCPTGPRKGRIVANVSTCHAPIKASAKQKMTVVRARAPKKASWKAKLTKKGSGVSRTVANLNKAKGSLKPRKIKKAKA